MKNSILKINFILKEDGEFGGEISSLKKFENKLTKKEAKDIQNKIDELGMKLSYILAKQLKEEDKMLQKKNNKIKKDCLNCEYCVPIGEGDHICEENPHKIVLENYIPSKDYNWCEGRFYRRR